MTEHSPELTEQDKADIAALHALPEEAIEYHPILKVWREILRPAEEEKHKRVTPQWASRICASYQEVGFADMVTFQDRYYTKIQELTEILDAEIETDSDCLTYGSPEEDVAENTGHYKNLLRDWQKQFLTWEINWDTKDPAAGVELAAISEVHKAFFGQTGLTQFLDNIKLELDEDWQTELAAELEAMKEGQ